MEDRRYKQAGGGIRVSEEMDGSHDKQAGGGMMAREEMDVSRYRHDGEGMMAVSYKHLTLTTTTVGCRSRWSRDH